MSSAVVQSWPAALVARHTYPPASEGLVINIVRLLTISLSPKLSLLISIVFACVINWLPILHHVICGLGRAVALQRKVADWGWTTVRFSGGSWMVGATEKDERSTYSLVVLLWYSTPYIHMEHIQCIIIIIIIAHVQLTIHKELKLKVNKIILPWTISSKSWVTLGVLEFPLEATQA